MIKEYKTIREIDGPLMVVTNVEGVTYDELAEIELPSGARRRCRVLEVDGTRLSYSTASPWALTCREQGALPGTQPSAGFPDMLERVFDGMGNPGNAVEILPTYG